MTREHTRADGTCDCPNYGDGSGRCAGCDCCDWQGSDARPDARCASGEHCPCGDAGAGGVIHCECGEITGVSCAWSGPEAETVVVEYMPVYLRASHIAAGNRGAYPANGAQRVRVERSCADSLTSVSDERDTWDETHALADSDLDADADLDPWVFIVS